MEDTVHFMTEQNLQTEKKKRRFGCLHVLGILLIVIIITAFLTGWWLKQNLSASRFEPTQLNVEEQQELESKLSRLEQSAEQDTAIVEEQTSDDPDAPIEPEPYRGNGEIGEFSFSEKELNAFIAEEPELADRLMFDLADDLISIIALIPIDDEIPLIGGRNLRVKCGIEVHDKQEKLFVSIRGVSIGGIPIPNAWLGEIKNKNLVEEFDEEGGFWDQLSEGIEGIKVREGHLWVKFKEDFEMHYSSKKEPIVTIQTEE
jgi:hypothetical protein